MTKKISKAGRPKGARNKLNAYDEIQKALSRGQGLVELKQWLWDMMNDPEVTELQKSKFAAMYLDVMKYIHSENLKLENHSPKAENLKTSTYQEDKPVSNVAKLSFGK